MGNPSLFFFFRENKMFKNIIRQFPIDKILIDRPNRQRTDLTFDSILSLAVSIGRSQWISPILIDEETNYLIAGERRLTAVKALYAAVNGDYSGFTNPDSAREELFPVCTCKVESWNNWEKIPAQCGKDFTPTDLLMYEFIENAHREDLPWQDRAKAIFEVHCKGLSENKNWTGVDTSKLIGVHRATVTENLRIWRMFADESASDEIKQIIKESPTLRSAAATLERYTSRRETGPGVTLSSGGMFVPKPKAEVSIYNKPGPAPGINTLSPLSDPLDFEEDSPTLSSKVLFNADFCQWAPLYTGEPFNFIHCDFPYGINFNTGEYSGTVENKLLNDYDDSPDVYWKLLNTLRDNPHLIAPQCHIMFWFSQNIRRETEDFFQSIGGVVQPFLMVWHCGSNEGLVPDPQRYGRRTYETAMLITFGDRKIVGPRSLSIEASRESSTRIHRSQKPIKVLDHFFRMFVDNSSIVLDPTAGSGTSLIVANDLKAKQITGLEINKDAYEKACEYIDKDPNMRM